jgi:hypothetical protein
MIDSSGSDGGDGEVSTASQKEGLELAKPNLVLCFAWNVLSAASAYSVVKCLPSGYTLRPNFALRIGGTCMKRLRILFLLVLTMMSANRLQASSQPNDPRIIISGGHDSLAPFTSIFGLTFTFFANGSGGGFLTFTNMSGVDWTYLEVNVPAPMPAGTIMCGGTAFTTCFVQPQTEGQFATVDFFGGLGILNGHTFTIDLGSSGWTPGFTPMGEFQAQANPVGEPEPEPATLVLFLTGFAPVLVRRHLRSGRSNDKT